MRLAIVIAANGPSQSPDRLRFAETDGDKIASRLQERRANFEVIRIPADMPAAEARGIIFDKAESCRPQDTFLTYFSGHGRAQKGHLLLQLNGSSVEKPLTTHLVASDLLEAFKGCSARSRILILDCCNAGGVARQIGIRGGETEVRTLGVESDKFDIIMASGFLESAYEIESLQGGFLTHGILEALGAKFFEADLDKDRAISFQDLTQWLEMQADQLNADRPTSQQIPRPARLGYGTGMSYLTRPPDESVIHEFILPNDTHTVLLPVFPQRALDFDFVVSMAVHPVTNAQYRMFVEATDHEEPVGKTYSAERKWHGPFRPWRDQSFLADDKPVVCVDAEDALLYCKWLSTQCDPTEVFAIMLPSERHWNAAAFRKSRWSFPPRDMQLQVHQRGAAPVSCVSAPERTSRLGLTDLFGNVWEWGGSESEWQNEVGPHSQFSPRSFFLVARRDQNMRQIRGGGFFDDIYSLEGHVRTTDLEDGVETRQSDLGFRVVAVHRTAAIAPEVLAKLKEYHPLIQG